MKHLRFKNPYGANSQLFKIFTRFMSFVLIICLSVVLLVYGYGVRAISKSLIQSNQSTAEHTAVSTESIFREIELVLGNLSGNNYVQTYVIAQNPRSLINELDMRLHELLSMLTAAYNYIDSIYVYSETNDKVFSTTFESSPDEIEDVNWLEMYEKNKQKYLTVYPRKKYNIYPNIITFMRPVSVGASKGAVLININPEEIEALSNSGEDKLQNTYMVTEDGTIIYSQTQSEIFTNTAEHPVLKEAMQNGAEEGILLRQKEGIYAVSQVVSSYYDWSYVNLYGPEDSIRDFATIRNLILFSLFIILAVGFAAAIYFSYTAYQPIQSILDILDRPEQWNQANKSDGEMKYIASRIVTMLQTNRDLETEFQKQMKTLNDTYAYALQVQINPHFLFNTLNLINMMIVDDYGVGQRSSKVLVELSRLLWYSLKNEDKFITVREEVECAKLYLDILSKRYPDLFTVCYDVSDSVLENLILKLSLQPLIENAVNHGLIPKESGGVVTVSVQPEGEQLRIAVTDNGVGMNAAHLEEVRQSVYSDMEMDSKHIGVKNVRQRIKLLLGEAYELTIESEENRGTCVSYTAPILMQPELQVKENGNDKAPM